ncbi:RNI-like protein [Violaceomyces palustris]|uniref:RNI-like protein n=1 Tax=Violaceomyces palustris TaxID=1673888 RepID=A0ACD0P234_9BASI|nr:RNI-like protein [Violaceomyces palustris]
MSRVRGPTSALTEFLRERGITARNANRFRRRDETENQPELEPQHPIGHDTNGNEQDPNPSSSRRSRGRGIRSSNNDSMNFQEHDDSDEEEEEEGEGSAEVAEGGSTSASGGKRKRHTLSSVDKGKKQAKKDSKDGGGDDDDELDNFLPQASSSRRNHTYSNRTPGSIDYCAMCKAKFTITQYTKMCGKGPLCHKCGPKYNEDLGGDGRKGAGGAKKPGPKKRVAKRKPTWLDANHREMPSLQSYCIDIISKFIEDVEALGDIGAKNMDSISKSISKNRRLNPVTVQLFLNPSVKKLSLYDCSKLDSESLQTLPTFAPNLEELNLQLCGCLDNEAMDKLSTKLKSLRKLDLYGPYLVRKEAWHRFFESVGERLVSLKIRESPRFDQGCVEKMVQFCPNLTELGLAQIGPLNDEMLKPLHGYDRLTYLDISYPGVSAPGVPPKSLQDRGVIDLLKAVGHSLEFLDLSKNADLTDQTVLEGIKPNCKRLKVLKLSECEKIESKAMEQLFGRREDETSPGLKELYVDRMIKLEDGFLDQLARHSGDSLIRLNLNSVDSITDEGFGALSRSFKNLEEIDLGFCRSVDDKVIESLCENLPNLKFVYVFGCNRVSDFAKSDRVKIVGKERYI